MTETRTVLQQQNQTEIQSAPYGGVNIYQRCSHDGSEPGIHIARLANLDAFIAALQAESARQHDELGGSHE